MSNLSSVWAIIRAFREQDTRVSALEGGSRRPITTIGLLGASTEQNCGVPSPDAPTATVAAGADYGYLPWALFKLGWSNVRFTKQGGESGDTSAQIDARADDFFKSADCPDAVVLGSGLFGNDFGAYTLAQSRANMLSIFRKAAASRKLIVYQTAQPHDTPPSSPAGDPDNYATKQAKLNQYGRDLCRQFGFLLHDVESLVTDAVTGKWRTEAGGQAWTGDGLHPYKYGAYRIGASLAELLRPWVSPGVQPSSGVLVADGGPANMNDPTNLLGSKGFFQTPTNGLAAGWAVGNVGSTFGDARTPTWTTTNVARGDGKGNWQKVTLTAPGAIAISTSIPGVNYPQGSVIDGAVEVKTDGDWGQVWSHGLFMQPVGSNNASAGLLNPSHDAADRASGRQRPDAGAGVFRVPRILRDGTAAGTGMLFIVYFWAEAGSIYLSRAVAKNT